MQKTLPEEENAAELKLGKEFKDAACLTNSEVAFLLDPASRNEMGSLQEDDPENQLNPVYIKALNYVKQFSRFKNKSAMKEVRIALQGRSLAEFEIAALANLCPDSAEEALTLIPSLKDKLDVDEVEGIVNDIRQFATY